MTANEIRVNGHYYAKINNRVVVVRVDAIREVPKHRGYDYSGKSVTSNSKVYDVTNTKTGRKTIFRSAGKFRGNAPSPQ